MMTTKFGSGLCALAILAVPASALAQDAENDQRSSQRVEASQNSAAPEQTCEKPKKKKGLGLGGVLRTARSSGLLGAVAGQVGADGYLLSSAANAAIDIGTAEAQQRQSQPSRETQAC